MTEQEELERAALLTAGNALFEALGQLKWPDSQWDRIADAVAEWRRLAKGVVVNE